MAFSLTPANPLARTARPRSIVDELKSMRLRTLLLSGLHDAGVPLERTMLLFELLPNAEFHVFSDAAHWVQWDQADRFNTLVADFLSAG